MNKSNLLCLILGLAAGSVGGFFAGKLYFGRKYEKQYEEDIDEMEKYYKKTDEYRKTKDEEDEEEPQEDDLEKRKEIREKLQRNYEETLNYAAMYDGPDITDDEDEINPEDDPKETQEYTEYHRRNMDREPRIISEAALGDVPAFYEFDTLFFYSEDKVLVTEEGEEIKDPALFIGDALDKYNFRYDDEQDVIYVKNYATDHVYTVQKIYASYEKEFESYD